MTRKRTLATMPKKRNGDPPETIMKFVSPDLKKLGDEIAERLRKHTHHDLHTAYEIGQRVSLAAKNEATYGLYAVRQLARHTGIVGGDRTLLDMALLAESYEWSFLERETRTPMKNGHCLARYHFIVLARIESAQKRKALLRRVREESLSVAQLQREVDVGYETKHTRSGGRKIKKPSSPAAGLSSFTKDNERLVKFEAVLNESVFDVLADMSPGCLQPELLDVIARAEASATVAMQSMKRILGRLTTTRTYIEQKLQARRDREIEAENEESEVDGVGDQGCTPLLLQEPACRKGRP